MNKFPQFPPIFIIITAFLDLPFYVNESPSKLIYFSKSFMLFVQSMQCDSKGSLHNGMYTEGPLELNEHASHRVTLNTHIDQGLYYGTNCKKPEVGLHWRNKQRELQVLLHYYTCIGKAVFD